jgi:hypothetical protein
LVLAVIGAVTVVAIAAATPVQAPETTFSVSRVQAEEVASVVGFVRAYNRRDLAAAIGYFTTTRQQGQTSVTATDCNYRRQKTEIYLFRKGLIQWLKRRFADHDRLTIGRIYDENPAQLTGVVAVEYARRTSDTLRKLGFANGIVPQAGQKLPIRFEGGLARFPFFGLASTGAPTPNPECALVGAAG